MDPILQELIDPTQAELNDSSFNKLTLNFLDSELETRFQSQIIHKRKRFIKHLITLILLWYLLHTIANIIYKSIGKASRYSEYFIKIPIIFILSLMRMSFQWEGIDNYLRILNTIGAFALTIFAVFNQYIDFKDKKIDFHNERCLQIIYFLSSFSTILIPPHFLLILSGLSYLIFIIIISIVFPQNINEINLSLVHNNLKAISFYVISSAALLLLEIFIFINIQNYKHESNKRNEYIAKTTLEYETEKINDVLAILLPKFVRDQMTNQGSIAMSEDQGDVVIMFCDICNFDKMVASEKNKIVEILDNLYRFYDKICQQHGIQKIETVGKTYMACGGLAACELSVPQKLLNVEKTRRVINMSLDMLAFSQKQSWGEDGKPLVIKIGIHYGRVIAGVIGHHKPQFSLIGDTVNTTSRVCSTGEEGLITISENSYEKVKNSDLFFKERIIYVKIFFLFV